MHLDKPGQAALLKLSEIDLEINQIKYEISKAIDSQELKNLQSELTGSAESLISSRTVFENLETSVKRAEEDIRLVTERLIRDRERLNATSSPKDAIGIQAEIDSLERRKLELEEVELGLLGELESAELELKTVSEARAEVSAEISSIQNQIQQQVDELKTRGRKLSADRSIVLEKIPAEILTRYEKLAARGIAVGQIIDRACSGCRMNMTVGFIDTLNSLPEDQIGTCPECQAMIVR